MSDTQLIKDKLDIVDLISEYVQLKPSGVNHKGLCPFHHEKTPSFMVNRDRQSWHCFGCFPPGQKVKTPFGLHNIEEIAKDHFVYSGSGNIRKVLATHIRDFRGELVHVSVRKLGGQVSMTSDHRLKVLRPTTKHYKKTKQFYRRCREALQKGTAKDTAEAARMYGEVVELSAGELQLNDFVFYPINKQVTHISELNLKKYLTKSYTFGPHPPEIPYTVRVTDDFLKLVGYWIAEGSNHRAYIRFSLGNHEEAFVQEIIGIIQRVFGIQAAIHRRKKAGKTGLEITACHTYLADIFGQLCGKGAAYKHIPFVFQEIPPDQQMILVNAIFKGDGHGFIANRSTKFHKSITTISHVLAGQLVDILLRNRLYPSLRIYRARQDKHGVNHRESYHIFWSEEARPQHAYVYTEDGRSPSYLLLPIKEIKKEKYSGPVYNLTVDKEHTYVATNFVVANCGKGGDAFSFVEEMEGMEFPEALKLLAGRAGVELTNTRSDVNSSQKNRIKEINTEAARFFHHFLIKMDASRPARDYVQKRGLREDTIEAWQIGYISDQWDLLTQYLLKKGYGINDLVASGLTIQRDGADVASGRGFYDRFRGRVMFPIWDVHDTVVGFTGRVLVETEHSGGKYVNTPQTLVYDKSRVVFGLNKAKQEIKAKDLMVMVEGQMDVIACHEAGMTNVVATSGTALTDEQVKLLKRYSGNMAIAFDADAAGESAAKRGIDVALREGMNIKIIQIPEGAGKDPDECVRTNPEIWQRAVVQAEDVMSWFFKRALANKNLSDPKQKQQVASVLLAEIAKIPYAVERDHWLQELGQRLGVDAGVLREDLLRFKEKDTRYKFTASSAGGQDTKGSETQTVNAPTTRHDLLVDRFLALLLRFPHLSLITYHVSLSTLSPYSELYEMLKKQYTETNSIDLQNVSIFFAREGQENIVDVLLMKGEKDFSDFSEDNARKECEHLMQEIKMEWVKKERGRLQHEITEAERSGNAERLSYLMDEFQRLSF